MAPEMTINELRLVQKKHENDRIDTCGLDISSMARDAADTIEELFQKLAWVSVEERLPTCPDYDWVLVKTELIPEGHSGVPHVAELRDGVWYCDCYDEPMEELLSVKVIAWFDMELLK